MLKVQVSFPELKAQAQAIRVGAFFVAYADGRDPADVAFLFGDIELYTLGASWLGVYPLGQGRADALLWGA